MKLSALFIFLVLLFVGCSDNLNVEFVELETNAEASLRGLFVVDENTIWASGSGGTVLLSTDAGKNWKNVAVYGAEENDFRSIHAWDENNAIVFGVAGPDFGYKTANGGETWTVVYSDTTSGLFFNSLKFADEKTGLAISDAIDEKPFLIKTKDGGNSWSRITNIPNVMEGETNFAASNTCVEILPSGKAWIITGGTAARVFYSHDFGENWEVTKTPITAGTPASGIFSVCFLNNMEGVIVGGTYDKPELNEKIAARTADGGLSWVLSETMPAEYRSCVQPVSYRNKDFFIAIGKTGCDISMDYGKNWNFLSEDSYFTIRMVPGKPIGFAAGSEGRIAEFRIGNLK